MPFKHDADNREFYRFEDKAIVPVFAKSNEIQRIAKMILKAGSDSRAKGILKAFFGLIIERLDMNIDGLDACTIRFSGKRNRWSERNRRVYVTSDSFHRARQSKEDAVTLLYNICHELAHGYMISLTNTSICGIQHNRKFFYSLVEVLKVATHGEIANIYKHRKSIASLDAAFEELNIGPRIKSGTFKKIVGNDLRQVIRTMSSRIGVKYLNPMKRTSEMFNDGKLPVLTFQAVNEDGTGTEYEGVVTKSEDRIILYYASYRKIRLN